MSLEHIREAFRLSCDADRAVGHFSQKTATEKSRMADNKYNAELSAGSLLIPESRKVADLILQGADEATWQRFVKVDNGLQKRTPASAKRQTRLLRNRLGLASPELLHIIVSGSNEAVTQALLAAAIKHSRLLGDFMDTVIRQHLRVYETSLAATDWSRFLEECAKHAPEVEGWAQSTRKKLGQVVIRILAEAKYLANTRSMTFRPVSLVPEVRHCLERDGEHYALHCMTLNP